MYPQGPYFTQCPTYNTAGGSSSAARRWGSPAGGRGCPSAGGGGGVPGSPGATGRPTSTGAGAGGGTSPRRCFGGFVLRGLCGLGFSCRGAWPGGLSCGWWRGGGTGASGPRAGGRTAHEAIINTDNTNTQLHLNRLRFIVSSYLVFPTNLTKTIRQSMIFSQSVTYT